MDAEIVLAAAGVAAGNFTQLPLHPAIEHRAQPHLRTDGRAVGDGPNKLEHNPSVAVADVLVKAVAFDAEDPATGHGQVKEPVIVKISPGASNRRSAVSYGVAADDPGESAVAIVVVEEVVAEHPIGDEQIEIAVIVVITQRCVARIAT